VKHLLLSSDSAVGLRVRCSRCSDGASDASIHMENVPRTPRTAPAWAQLREAAAGPSGAYQARTAIGQNETRKAEGLLKQALKVREDAKRESDAKAKAKAVELSCSYRITTRAKGAAENTVERTWNRVAQMHH